MSTETNTNASVNQGAEAHSDKDSAGVSYTNTVEAGASVTTGNDNASVTAGVSVKTGTEASAEAGLDGNNVYAEASYSNTTEAHATIEGQANTNGVGVSGGVDAYIVTGDTAEGHISVGDKGVDVGGGVSTGTAVGVDATATADLGGASVTTGAGVSVGDQFAVGGGGQATFDDGVATIGVEGDLAAYVGLDVDLSVSVDTNQVAKDAEAAAKAADDAAKEAQKAADDAAKAAEKAANDAAQATANVAKDAGKAVTDTAKDAGKSISNSAKKTGKSIKKAFSDIRLKENITLVGTTDGLNIYQYNYKWSNQIQTGVMAQELLGTKYDSAVSCHKSGYFMVDYSQLPL